MKNPLYPRSAFSLLELLMVLALLAMLASVAVPSLKSWQSRIEVDRATGVLMEIIGDARLRSVREGISCQVRTSLSPSNLTLEPLVDSQKSNSTETFNLPSSVHIEFYVAGTHEPLDYLTISSRGNLGPAVIRLTQNGQCIASYESDRLTGGIRRVRE